MATGTIKQTANNSENGYCKMPDGTLLQWGIQTVTSGTFTASGEMYFLATSISFPLPFINNASFVSGSSKVGSSVELAFGVTSASETTATVRNMSTQAIALSSSIPLVIRWFAVGRWK